MSDSEKDYSEYSVTKDNDSSGGITELVEKTKSYVSLIGELRKSEEDVDDSENLRFITAPSSQDIVKEAHKKLLAEEELTEDELPYDNPRVVILEAQKKIVELRDDLVGEIERIIEKEEGNVSGADIDTMLYIVDKKAGKTGRHTVIGGAESFIRNLSDKNNWHPYELKLVLNAHEIAAKENNYHRHLLHDLLIIIPNHKKYLLN